MSTQGNPELMTEYKSTFGNILVALLVLHNLLHNVKCKRLQGYIPLPYTHARSVAKETVRREGNLRRQFRVESAVGVYRS